MKNFKAGRKLKKNSKQQVAGCSGAVAVGCEFRYAQFFAIIAKVTVHRENQKFRYAQIFAKLAKITVPSEIFGFRYFLHFSLYSEIFAI